MKGLFSLKGVVAAAALLGAVSLQAANGNMSDALRIKKHIYQPIVVASDTAVNDTVDKSKAIEIQEVEVKDNSRNNGIGTLLVKKCIEIADENESDIYLYAASLETVGNKENTEKLLKWYRKLGFEQVPDSEFDKNLGQVKKEQCLVRRYKK